MQRTITMWADHRVNTLASGPRPITRSLQSRPDLGFANFTSYTQYRRDLSSAYNDFTFLAANIFVANLKVKQETVTQVIPADFQAEQRAQWTAGTYYYGSQERWDFDNATTSPFTPILSNGTNTYSFAGYGDLTYQFTHRFLVTAGARYSIDRVTHAWFYDDYPDIAVIPNYQSDRLTPRAVIAYKPTEQSTAYISYTKGYKAGILNVGGDQYAPVKPETVNAYEWATSIKAERFPLTRRRSITITRTCKFRPILARPQKSPMPRRQESMASICRRAINLQMAFKSTWGAHIPRLNT